MMKKKLAALVLMMILCMSMTAPTTAYAADTSYKNWLQSDSRWGSINLGSSSYTMKSSGCLVTAISMLVCHTGSASASSFSPATLVKYLNSNGGFTSSGALYWAKVTGVTSTFSLANWKVSLSGMSQSEKTSTMAQYLKDGYAVIISVKNGSHWVALDSINGSTVYMMDPSSSGTSLYSTYDVSNVDRLAIFKGKNSCGSVVEEDSSSSDTTASSGKGTVNCSSLYVRSNAGTSNSIITSISKGTSVTILGEAKDSSGTKWYKVSVNSKTGYVCGSYITVTSTSSDSNTSSDSSASSSDSSTSTQSGVVNCSSLNVRKGAGTSNSVVTTIERNQKVTITGSKNDSSGTKWYAVKFTVGSKDYEGYVSAAYITASSSDSSMADNSAGDSTSDTSIKAVVNCSALNMRKGAGTGNAIVKTLSKGTEVTITGEAKDSSGTKWYKIKTGSTTGYVHSSYLTKKSSDSTSSSDTNSSESSESSTTNTTMKVSYDSVYVRSGAGTSNGVVTVVYKNETVQATAEKKDSSGAKWYKITTTSGKNGYIRSDLLTAVSTSSGSSSSSSSSNASSSSSKKSGTTTDGVNVRKGAGTSNNVIVAIESGIKVTILGEKNDSNGTKWYNVSFTYEGTKYEGYISAQYVK